MKSYQWVEKLNIKKKTKAVSCLHRAVIGQGTCYGMEYFGERI